MRRGTSRRRFLGGLGGVVVLGTAWGTAGAETRRRGGETEHAAAGWPHFRGGPANAQSQPADYGPVGPLTREWTTRFEADLLSNGVSLTVVGDTVVVGDTESVVHGLSLATGERRWTDQADGSYVQHTTSDGEAVYFGPGSDSDRFYAVDVASGEARWTADIESRTVRAPAVAGGTVYASTAASVATLSASDGAQTWESNPAERPVTSVCVGSDYLFVGGSGGTVYALDRATGDERWTFETGGPILRDPTYHRGTVFAGGGDTLYALDAADGSERWTLADAGFAGVTAARGDAVVHSGDELLRLGAESGRERWRVDTAPVGVETPVLVGGNAYVHGGSDTSLYVHHADSGATHSSQDLFPGVIDSTARWSTVTGGRILMHESNEVHCFTGEHERPSAAFSAAVEAGQLTLDASATTAGGAPIQRYEWRVGDATAFERTGRIADVAATPPAVDVALRVTDEGGGVDVTADRITVPTRTPTATPTADAATDRPDQRTDSSGDADGQPADTDGTDGTSATGDGFGGVAAVGALGVGGFLARRLAADD